MKHVFLVHSNLTYLAALGTICKERLSESDVLIITRYKLSDQLPVKAFHLDFRRNLKRPWKSNWLINPLKYVDLFLKAHIGEGPFIAYLDAMVYPAKIIVSNSRCKTFNFIEEGASAYYDYVPKSLIIFDDVSDIKCPLRYDSFRRRIIDIITVISGISLKNYALPYMPHCYFFAEGVKFYGFSDKSFYGARMKETIYWTSIAERFTFKKKYSFKNCCIWIGIPPQVLITKISPDEYIEGIEKRCIPHLLKRGVKKIFIKHHPICRSDYKSAELNAFLRNGVDVEVLPDDICLEMEFLNEGNISIYTVMSSLVRYALQMGDNVCYSIANHFPGFIEEDGTDVWDKVEML